jgi:sulfur relay (sulfurtransferase) complex TusBCD TusD component (DsrE family)
MRRKAARSYTPGVKITSLCDLAEMVKKSGRVISHTR